MNPYCSQEMRSKFENILTQNNLVVVSSLGCPPCKKIKQQFKENKISFHETDISDPDNEELFYCIYEKSKSRYVPQIFHNGSYIGGFTEGLNNLNEGKFDKI
jgi:glutaredoxin